MNRMAAAALVQAVCVLASVAVFATERSDPTRPPQGNLNDDSAAAAKQGRPILHSILHGSQRQLAVIDGRVLRVGDQVHDMTITAIDARQVELYSPGNGRLVLSLGKRTMEKDYR